MRDARQTAFRGWAHPRLGRITAFAGWAAGVRGFWHSRMGGTHALTIGGGGTTGRSMGGGGTIETNEEAR